MTRLASLVSPAQAPLRMEQLVSAGVDESTCSRTCRLGRSSRTSGQELKWSKTDQSRLKRHSACAAGSGEEACRGFQQTCDGSLLMKTGASKDDSRIRHSGAI